MAGTNPTNSQSVGRWFSIAFTIFVLTVLSGGYFVLQVLPKTYTATAMIQVRPEEPLSDNTGSASVRSFDPTAFQAEFAVIESSDVLLPIITDLNLDQIWAKQMHQGNGEKLHPLDALNYLKENLRIEMVRGTDILRITVKSDVPTEAADIANAIADRYKTMRDAQEDQRNYPIARQLSESPVRIVLRAQAPGSPSRPNKKLDLALTVVVGIFLGVLVASVMEPGIWASRRFRAS